MLARLLRGLGLLAYALVVLLAFGLTAYMAFSFFVRSGVTSMPALTGLTREEAANLLADHGLALRKVSDQGRYDDRVPSGRVVQQRPDEHTLVKRGSGVAIILSLGPQQVTVPALTGRSLPAAQAELSGNGLSMGKILGALAPGKAPGTVIEQDPDPQAEVAPSTPVDMLLAMAVPGDRFVMPDLIYRDYDRIQPFFAHRGFRFGSVKYERYEGVAAGSILRQFPLPGHPLSRSDAISLVVATADNLPEGAV
jgi:eukaryotic-like serine/threonine-protein kinase